MENGGLPLRCGRVYREYRLCFFASVLAGLAAHMFALTNKLPNHDDIESLFGKGATVTSGRWGLELTRLLFPDYSMPWLYGIISIVLIAAAVCAAVAVLEIKSKPLQVILGALVLSFPSLTGTFCFMFTAAPYALAFLLSVLAAYGLKRESLPGYALAAVCLIFSLSIYQAYISVTAGLIVLTMISRTLDGRETVWRTLLYGLKALAAMVMAVALYYGLSLLVLRCSGAGFNDYVTGNVNGASLPTRIKMAYEAFRDVFVFRNFYLISTEFSRYLHMALLPILVVLLLPVSASPSTSALGQHLRWALLIVLTVLVLPLALFSMYLVMAGDSIHTLVLYSFVCVYMLAALLIERARGRQGGGLAKIAALLLCAVALCNVFFANMCYLKLHMQYENAYAFYTAMTARISGTEGFDGDCRLAIVGRQDNLLYSQEQFDTELLMGPPRELINIYSSENFIRWYLGFDVPFAGERELAALEGDTRVAAMPEYPYEGSVKRIDDYLVVKLG